MSDLFDDDEDLTTESSLGHSAPWEIDDDDDDDIFDAPSVNPGVSFREFGGSSDRGIEDPSMVVGQEWPTSTPPRRPRSMGSSAGGNGPGGPDRPIAPSSSSFSFDDDDDDDDIQMQSSAGGKVGQYKAKALELLEPKRNKIIFGICLALVMILFLKSCTGGGGSGTMPASTTQPNTANSQPVPSHSQLKPTHNTEVASATSLPSPSQTYLPDGWTMQGTYEFPPTAPVEWVLQPEDQLLVLPSGGVYLDGIGTATEWTERQLAPKGTTIYALGFTRTSGWDQQPKGWRPITVVLTGNNTGTRVAQEVAPPETLPDDNFFWVAFTLPIEDDAPLINIGQGPGSLQIDYETGQQKGGIAGSVQKLNQPYNIEVNVVAGQTESGPLEYKVARDGTIISALLSPGADGSWNRPGEATLRIHIDTTNFGGECNVQIASSSFLAVKDQAGNLYQGTWWKPKDDGPDTIFVFTIPADTASVTLVKQMDLNVPSAPVQDQLCQGELAPPVSQSVVNESINTITLGAS